MCSIVGLQGNFKADDLIAMLKTSKIGEKMLQEYF